MILPIISDNVLLYYVKKMETTIRQFYRKSFEKMDKLTGGDKKWTVYYYREDEKDA